MCRILCLSWGLELWKGLNMSHEVDYTKEDFIREWARLKERSSVGLKHDTGKNDMGLLFREVPYGLEEVSKALQMGSAKYGVGNWLKVEDGNSRYLSALVRHLTAYYKGEETDPESGLNHLAHVATNALFLIDLEKRK